MDICLLLPGGLGWAAESPSHPYPSPSYFTLLLTPKGPVQPATTIIMLTSVTTAPCLTREFTGALS